MGTITEKIKKSWKEKLHYEKVAYCIMCIIVIIMIAYAMVLLFHIKEFDYKIDNKVSNIVIAIYLFLLAVTQWRKKKIEATLTIFMGIIYIGLFTLFFLV